MHLYPKNIIKILEFDKILEMSKSYCIGEPAKNSFDAPFFYTDIDILEVKLLEVEEMKASIISDSPLTLEYYKNITQSLKNLKVIGFVLSIDALKNIDSILKGAQHIKRYFTTLRLEQYPVLGQLAAQFDLPKEIIDIIDEVLDEDGEIKPNASVELMRINRAINSKKIEINKVFNSIASDLKARGLLSETVETYRNGRRVLTLPAENKRKIKGIIHDESATGKTVYIEPEMIIHLNNDLFNLEGEFNKEIYKILKKLSDSLRPFIDILALNLSVITDFDVVAAKAKLSINLNANKPIIDLKPGINFIKAYHPLLLLKNNSSGMKTVPFEMTLKKGNRIVVISGPNAGGKSVTLKAVGLLQMMTQAGYLIPADEKSKVGIFKKIFADIGDQQSLEDDLSTYSSRLRNMKSFLAKADENTLFLIDEFGSGTDPKIGGAIAEAILKELNIAKSWGVITTHYSNIKVFAFKVKGIINAAMHFDKKKILPTYNFILGKPGSSFAFEIAQNTGLSKKILNYARFKAGKNIKKIEELLVDLQNDKAELESKILLLKEKELVLDKLTDKYQKMQKELDFNKKKLKLEKKEISLININKTNKEVQNLISELRKNQKIEEAKKLSEKLSKKKQNILEETKSLNKSIISSTKKDWKKLKEGDYVKLKTGNLFGKITKISKNKAELETGNMAIMVPLHDLLPAKKPISMSNTASINTRINRINSKFNTTIDIRGYSKAEAMESIQNFFDEALLANASLLKVLHGKGNGILRNTVKQMAREYRTITELWHPPMDQGGDGITFVKMD